MVTEILQHINKANQKKYKEEEIKKKEKEKKEKQYYKKAMKIVRKTSNATNKKNILFFILHFNYKNITETAVNSNCKYYIYITFYKNVDKKANL